jgi:hypothetical protein
MLQQFQRLSQNELEALPPAAQRPSAANRRENGPETSAIINPACEQRLSILSI